MPKRGQKAETAASALPSPWDTEFEVLLCNSSGDVGGTPRKRPSCSPKNAQSNPKTKASLPPPEHGTELLEQPDTNR